MSDKRTGMAELPEWINENHKNYEKRMEAARIAEEDERLAARLAWKMELADDVRRAKLITFLIVLAVIVLVTANEILTDKFIFQ